MPQPAVCMTAGRVVMGPVDDSASFIPFVLALEQDDIAAAKIRNARREIDVVGDQNRLA